MTTAARPTFDPAKGGTQRGETSLSSLSQQFSTRDLPGHLKLKERKPGQAPLEEVKQKDLKAELEHRERITSIEKEKYRPSLVPSIEYATQIKLAIKAERQRSREDQDKEFKNEEDKTDRDKSDSNSPDQQLPAPDLRLFAQLDADEDLPGGKFANTSDSDDDNNVDQEYDDDDEEGTAELMAELEKIRKERAADQEKRESEARARDERVRMESILSGNPLLSEPGESNSGSFKIKRRWDDDVVFKNCARGEPVKKQYVNDMLRLEFHKKFMDKYIQ